MTNDILRDFNVRARDREQTERQRANKSYA